MTGIYRLRNKINNHAYVGSSMNIERRWSQHTKKLQEGDHHSPYLQNAWTKYGEMVFEFEIVEQCRRSKLLEREQHHFLLESPVYNGTRNILRPHVMPEWAEPNPRNGRSCSHALHWSVLKKRPSLTTTSSG